MFGAPLKPFNEMAFVEQFQALVAIAKNKFAYSWDCESDDIDDNDDDNRNHDANNDENIHLKSDWNFCQSFIFEGKLIMRIFWPVLHDA